MADFVIPLHDLAPQGKDFVFALNQAWLDRVFDGTGVRGDVEQGACEVRVHAQLNGREVLVHGRASAKLVAECGRCLKGLPLDVACDVAALYAPGDPNAREKRDQEADEDLDIDPEAPDLEFYSGDQIVIDDLVRDYLLLELPMHPSCELGWACPNLDVPEHMRSAEGVRSKGFDEDAIDPRLAPLKKLAKKSESDKE